MKKMIRKLCALICPRIFYLVLDLLYKEFGVEILNQVLPFITKNVTRNTLKKYGAILGTRLHFSAGIKINNALTNNYSNLKIGNNCYIGRGVFFDLVSEINIEDYCVIAAEVMFSTHFDIGERPLRKIYQRKTGRIKVGRGTYIGARAIILPGVSIGECSIIGAGAVVNKDIPPYVVAVGVPATVVKDNKDKIEKIQNNFSYHNQER